MFKMLLLPALEGDCIVLEYGRKDHPHRVLIDGGRKETRTAISDYVAGLPPGEQDFDLIVVTHIDNDHIEGVLAFLPSVPDTTEVWFNGPDQLKKTPPPPPGPPGLARGIPEGNRLLGGLRGLPWNTQFGRGAVAAWQPPVTLEGGLKLTVLSPDKPALKRLEHDWKAISTAAGLERGTLSRPVTAARPFVPPAGPDDIRKLADPSVFDGDGSATNQSSIALLAEYGGKRVLLGGDAFADTLLTSLEASQASGGSAGVPIDLVKLPHHGSDGNTSVDLLEFMGCDRFAVSTNGGGHHHPDPACIARIITRRRDAQLLFNYRSTETACWDDPGWKAEFGYSATYPAPDRQGWLTIEV
ncbi:MAG: hypothetical protein WC971_10040 [Coriobacteriia bacterium]